MSKDWLTILEAIGIVLSFCIIYLAKKLPWSKWAISLKKKRSLDKWIQGIDDSMVIGGELSRLYNEHNIPRNSFFVAHNGGGIPTKETSFYTSVKDACGVTKDGGDLRSQMYRDFGQKIEVDIQYRVMIEAARQNGHVHLKTKDMPPSTLKDIYIEYGVAESVIVYYDFDVETKIFSFSSHARYESDPEFDHIQVSAIIRSGNRLRSRFESRAH